MINLFIRFAWCAVLLGMSLVTYGQVTEVKIKTKNPSKLYKMAIGAVQNQDNFLALVYFEELQKRGFENDQQLHEYAKLLTKLGKYEPALEAYTTLENKKYDHPLLSYEMGLLYQRMEQPQMAQDYFNFFLKSKNVKTDFTAEARNAMEQKNFLEKRDRTIDTILYSTYNLDKRINSPGAEFSPLITEDGLIFGSQNVKGIYYMDATKKSKSEAETFRTLYITKGQKNELSDPEPMGITVPGYEISGISLDISKRVAYISACKFHNEKKRYICSIFQSKKLERKDGSMYWTDPEPIHELNEDGMSSTQVACGYDNKRNATILFFVSDREGSRGGNDIWYSYLNPKTKKFGKIANAGSKINTSKDELTPYFHMPTSTLYFSSNGRGGYGGYDIFSSELKDGVYQEVKNLPLEINSSQDDLFFMPYRNLESGYIVSNRYSENSLLNPHCCDDIFYFERAKEPKVKTKTKINLNVQSKNKDTLGTYRYQVTEIDTSGKRTPIENKEVVGNTTIEDLEQNRTYEIEIQAKKYYRKKHIIDTKQDSIIEITIPLDSINYDPIILPLVEFDYDSFSLTPQAKVTIDSLVYPILIDNPNLKIELSAHTDSRGTDAYNEELSLKRAHAIRNYLILTKWIDPYRLTAKGYGEYIPIAPNENEDGSDNPEGRQRNRRCEFRILEEEVIDY